MMSIQTIQLDLQLFGHEGTPFKRPNSQLADPCLDSQLARSRLDSPLAFSVYERLFGARIGGIAEL